MTHDYASGTAQRRYSAAMNVLDGTVIGRNMQRHRHQEFIRFLNVIEKQVPVGKTIHAIVDNYAAHKHPNVRRWPRTSTAMDVPFHSDIGFLAQRGRRLLRRPSHKAATKARRVFRSVADLQAAINRFLEEHNQKSQPFTWTADPDEIIAAVRRGHQALDSIH